MRPTLTLMVAAISVCSHAAYAEPLPGHSASSEGSCSSWLDLPGLIDFRHGEVLGFEIGSNGSARVSKVLIRFLPKNGNPESDAGVDGSIDLPQSDGMVQYTLREDHPSTVQISVHGGLNPWGKYPLVEGNGCPKLERINRLE